jgi:hypothetical protein
LPFDFSDFFCFAENMCLVDGKQPIAVLIIAKDQELVHLNRLRCHLFFRLHLQPCHRQCHLTSADSPHIQHEATILHELHSMTPAAFRAELRASLTSFYEDILKVPGAGGRPQAKIIKRWKLCRRASSSRTPIAAEGGAAEGSAAAEGGASADEGGAAVGNGDGGGGATTPPPPTSVPRSCVHRDQVPCQNRGPEGARAGGCLVALNIKHPCNPIPVCCCNSIANLLPGGAHNFI